MCKTKFTWLLFILAQQRSTATSVNISLLKAQGYTQLLELLPLAGCPLCEPLTTLQGWK